MSSLQSTVDFILDQIAGAGVVWARKMFGEYGVYCDEKTVALICDDQLFVKPTAVGKAYLGTFEESCPFPGAKPWLLIPGDRWEERDWLASLVKITASELPLPKKRPQRRRKS